MLKKRIINSILFCLYILHLLRIIQLAAGSSLKAFRDMHIQINVCWITVFLPDEMAKSLLISSPEPQIEEIRSEMARQLIGLMAILAYLEKGCLTIESSVGKMCPLYEHMSSSIV